MQGSYKNQGLPRPYYMKPVVTKNSPYLKNPQNFFTTPKRKVIGYLILIFLFGSCMWLVSQDIKEKPPAVYEVDKTETPATGNVGNIVDQAKNAENENHYDNLRENMAVGPEGKKGMGVAEAPKGGIANEAPMVGGDADAIVDGATKKKSGNKADRINAKI